MAAWTSSSTFLCVMSGAFGEVIVGEKTFAVWNRSILLAESKGVCGGDIKSFKSLFESLT